MLTRVSCLSPDSANGQGADSPPTTRRALFFGLCLALMMAPACDDPVPAPSEDAGSRDLGIEDVPRSLDAGQDAARDVAHLDLGSPDGGSVQFDDHTVGRFENEAALRSYLLPAPGRSQSKFVLTHFQDDEARTAHYQQGRFYSLHDEWYWFRLLNGEPIPGCDIEAVQGLSFSSIEEVYAWARTQTELPLDLKWTSDERLYSPEFYRLGLDEPRQLGLGGLLHIPARSEPEAREELWLFELEYSDTPTHADILRFFQTLEATLPESIAGRLKWVTRSAAQRTLAATMRQAQLPYWDRVMAYSELAVPGEVEVYSPGLTAGQLRFVRDPNEANLSESTSAYVLALQDVPDWLPPAAALLTAVPQTPMAHVNLLARNRGIPNAYLGGVLEDPSLDQLARGYSPILVSAKLPSSLQLVPISRSAFRTYRDLLEPPELSVPPIDLSAAPIVVDLGQHSLGEMENLRPLVGGKSAGFLGLMAALPDDGSFLATPPRPLAVTIKAYVEHMAEWSSMIQSMLDDPDFKAEAQVRLLVLEGEDDLTERNPSMDVQAFVNGLRAERSEEHPILQMIEAGGLRRMIRDRPVAPQSLATIRQALIEHFGHYAASQGLRFRSSSNVEDIEGFNGAGLYDSCTGFLDAPSQSREKDQKKDIAWALRRTWSSYWAFEAFEERRLSKVDHGSGAMGVLVHARFDDPMEESNGVFTMTLLPEGLAEEQARMELNVQLGDLSVTNPPPGSNALPEIVVVRQGADDAPIQLERVRPSSEVAEGTQVLDDATLRQLFAASRRISEAWLDNKNAPLSRSQAARVLVLDFEFRLMSAGWPATEEAATFPRRLIVKQARSLDPGLLGVPESLREGPFPRDVLARARRVERHFCRGSELMVILREAYTDPGRAPDLGHGSDPFVGVLALRFEQGIQAMDIPAEHEAVVTHLDLGHVEHPDLEEGDWSLSLELKAQAAEVARFDRLEISEDGQWTVGRGEQLASGGPLTCTVTALHSTATDYLLDLLQSSPR